jgi:glutamate synthase domain-containing protein 3
VLEHEGTVYGIFGNYDAAVVYAGATVTLQGTVDDGMMTTCQQGTPFVVEDAQSSD